MKGATQNRARGKELLRDAFRSRQLRIDRGSSKMHLSELPDASEWGICQLSARVNSQLVLPMLLDILPCGHVCARLVEAHNASLFFQPFIEYE